SQHHLFHPSLWDREPPEPGCFRYGIELATTNGWMKVLPPVAESWTSPSEFPTKPLIHPYGATGTRHRLDIRAWLWPRSPAAKVAVSCEWPAAHIPLSRKEFDATPRARAARRAIRLWDGAPPHGNQLWLSGSGEIEVSD